MIFKPTLSKMRIRFFLAFSPNLPDVVLIAAKQSSPYNPIFFPKRFSSEWRIESPISSQISAPSKLPMVTSNVFVLFRFVHARLLLESSDFRACLIILISLSGMLANCLLQAIAWSSKSSEMDG